MLAFNVIAIRVPVHYVMSLNSIAILQSLLYLFACWIVFVGRASRSRFVLIILFALIFRMVLVFTTPRFSTDIYRYIWDGRVQAAGVNPYRYIPADPALAHLRDAAIYPHINRRDYAHTIYPPVAEGIFFAVTRASESVTWMKTAILSFEAVTVWAMTMLLVLLGLPRERVLLYAWHPLVFWEFAGGGHIDAAAIAFITIALLARCRRWETLTGIALGCAMLVKLFPIILFPALYYRWGWRMPAAFGLTVMAGYLPYASVGTGVFGFLPGYANEEGLLNGNRFFLLNLARRMGWKMPTELFIALVLVALLGISCWALWRPERNSASYVGRAFLIAVAFTVALSPHYLWYFTWLVPFLCFAPFLSILYLTSASTFLFGAFYGSWFGNRDEMFLVNVFLYAPFLFLVLFDLWRYRKTRKAASRDPFSDLYVGG